MKSEKFERNIEIPVRPFEARRVGIVSTEKVRALCWVKEPAVGPFGGNRSAVASRTNDTVAVELPVDRVHCVGKGLRQTIIYVSRCVCFLFQQVSIRSDGPEGEGGDGWTASSFPPY